MKTVDDFINKPINSRLDNRIKEIQRKLSTSTLTQEERINNLKLLTRLLKTKKERI